MTTSAEIRKWVEPFVGPRRGVCLRGRWLYSTPINHIFCGIFFEGSSDKTDPRPRWYVAPAFTPVGLPIRTWSRSIVVPRSTDEGFGVRLVDLFAETFDNTLKAASSIEGFVALTQFPRTHEALTGPWELAKNPVTHACVLAALGRFGDASVVAEAGLSTLPFWRDEVAKGQELLAKRSGNHEAQLQLDLANNRLLLLLELQKLGSLAKADDALGVASLLQTWEVANVTLWKVRDLWQSTSFPFETG